MLSSNDFIEYANVFDNYYGTVKSLVDNKINNGQDLIFDIDWQGAQQLREKMRENVVSIFILPPSKKRIRKKVKESWARFR